MENINYFIWNRINNNEVNLLNFIAAYPNKKIISYSRILKNHHYYTKIISKEIYINYYINFEIAESLNRNYYYVRGSLIYRNKIKIETAKILIKNILPKGYTPINFYDAEEKVELKDLERKPRLILIRDENMFFNQILNLGDLKNVEF